MNNKLTRFNRVRYTMYGKAFTSLSNFEAKGWDDDLKELVRSEKYDGITTVLNNFNLEFYGKAFNAIKAEYDVNGIKGDVRIEKEERNDFTDEWELRYTGYLDFSTYKQNKNFIQIKVNDSKFFSNIENRFKDQFELERLDDLKGGVLQPLTYKKLKLQGRDIFRGTKFVMNKNYYVYSDKTPSFAFPMDLLYKSDENVFAPVILSDSSGLINENTAFCISRLGATNVRFSANQLFYITADEQLTYNFKIKFKYKISQSSDIDNYNNRIKIFVIDKCYDNGNTINNWQSNQREVLEQIEITQQGVYYEGSVDKSFSMTVGVGESFVFSYGTATIFDGGFSYCQITDFELLMDTITYSKTTDCNTLNYFQVFERLLQIITGKNCFQSDLLSNEWKDLLFTNGFKIRNNAEKNITTSLDEIFESLNSIDDVGIFIKNGVFRVERKNYAYETTQSIDLGKVSNVEREIKEKLHYSTIELGSDFVGVYEEINGLDEFNIKTQYTTCIDEIDNKFNAVSKVRFDAYGMTIAQEKQTLNFPKLDTKYDKINFGIDCFLDTDGFYKVRHWQMDFMIAPTGIFSISTVFNLRLSPFNSLLRKGKTISTGLVKFPFEKLKYSSTEGNSQLVTLYPERANINNNVLPAPYFLPEVITFDRVISMTEFEQIVNNPYKLIKFVNEFGVYEYGYVHTSIKPNKEGKFILIKANL